VERSGRCLGIGGGGEGKGKGTMGAHKMLSGVIGSDR